MEILGNICATHTLWSNETIETTDRGLKWITLWIRRRNSPSNQPWYDAIMFLYGPPYRDSNLSFVEFVCSRRRLEASSKLYANRLAIFLDYYMHSRSIVPYLWNTDTHSVLVSLFREFSYEHTFNEYYFSTNISSSLFLFFFFFSSKRRERERNKRTVKTSSLPLSVIGRPLLVFFSSRPF